MDITAKKILENEIRRSLEEILNNNLKENSSGNYEVDGEGWHKLLDDLVSSTFYWADSIS